MPEQRSAHHARKMRRHRERVLKGGRLVATHPGLRHGTRSTYSYWGCHCPLCTAANTRGMAEYMAQWRARSRS